MIGVPASRPVLVAVPPPPPPANTMQLPIERNPPPLKNPLLVVDVKFALAAELVIKARGAGLLAGVPWASDGEVVTLSERLPLFTVPEVLNCESRVPVMPSSGSLQTTPPAAYRKRPKVARDAVCDHDHRIRTSALEARRVRAIRAFQIGVPKCRRRSDRRHNHVDLIHARILRPPG